MLGRQKTGSVVCVSCGRLVGVNDAKCFHCGRPNPSLWGFAGVLRRFGDDLSFGYLVIAVCLALYLVSLSISGNDIGRGGLFSFYSPSSEATWRLGSSGSAAFFRGRFWTVLTAGWLHGGLIHIGFNLFCVTQLAPVCAKLYGPARSCLIYLGSSALGFLLSSMVGIPLALLRGGFVSSVGASAAVFGWLGALLCYRRSVGSRSVSQQLMWGLIIPLFLMGFLIKGVDNWAHIGGFAGGYLIARWLDPQRDERPWHMLAALAFLVATAVAFGVSILTSF